MRRRLLWATLGSVALAVLLLGLPLTVAVQGLLAQQALVALQQEAEQVQGALNQQGVGLGTGTFLQEMAAGSELRLVLLDVRGSFAIAVDTGAPPEIPEELVADLVAAGRGEVGRVRGPGVLAVSVPVRFGEVNQILRAVRDDGDLLAAQRSAVLAIVGIGVTALGLAAILATLSARRLARPLEALAAAASQLGRGDFSMRAPRSGLPEPDEVADALDRTAERLSAMVERSRSFGADASHQLRTPLTALRLDLEALEASGADPALLEAAVAEADRLEATITELLTLADLPLTEEDVIVDGLAAARIDALRPLAAAARRAVVLQAAPVPPVRARTAALGQGLQVLLDNALKHGRGTITVTVEATAGPDAGRLDAAGASPSPPWVRLCVTDEGDGVDAEVVPGRGLRLARSLVEAEGGRLAFEGGATVCLLLPAA